MKFIAVQRLLFTCIVCTAANGDVSLAKDRDSEIPQLKKQTPQIDLGVRKSPVRSHSTKMLKSHVSVNQTPAIDLSAGKSSVQNSPTKILKSHVGAADLSISSSPTNYVRSPKAGICIPGGSSGKYYMQERPEAGWDAQACKNTRDFEIELEKNHDAVRNAKNDKLARAWGNHINAVIAKLNETMAATFPAGYSGARQYHIRIKPDGTVTGIWPEFQKVGVPELDFLPDFPNAAAYDKFARKCIAQMSASKSLAFPKDSQMTGEDVSFYFNSNIVKKR